MKIPMMLLFGLLVGAPVWCQQVDGRVSPGEYRQPIQVFDGQVQIYYAADRDGGIYFAVSARTKGWVGLGLGTPIMDGATIFMGYVRDGKAVFSEQLGNGHTHSPNPEPIADASATGQDGDITTIEFHIKAGKLPFTTKKFNYIVAFSPAADLTTFHEDNETGGTITLP